MLLEYFWARKNGDNNLIVSQTEKNTVYNTLELFCLLHSSEIIPVSKKMDSHVKSVSNANHLKRQLNQPYSRSQPPWFLHHLKGVPNLSGVEWCGNRPKIPHWCQKYTDNGFCADVSIFDLTSFLESKSQFSNGITICNY